MTSPVTFDKWFDKLLERIRRTPYVSPISEAKASILGGMKLTLKDSWARNTAAGGSLEGFTGSMMANVQLGMKAYCERVEDALIEGGMGRGDAELVSTLLNQDLTRAFTSDVTWFVKKIYTDWLEEQRLFQDGLEE